MDNAEDLVREGNSDKTIDLNLGLLGLVDILREQYNMSDDGIILFLVAVNATEEELSRNFILQNVLSRKNLDPVRDVIREEFEATKPRISEDTIRDYIKLSNAPIKAFL